MEHLFGGMVEDQDSLSGIDSDDRIHRRLDDA
jgi:hypothetical protein